MTLTDSEFVIGAQRYRLVADYYSSDNLPPDTESERGLYTDEEVDTVLRWCEVYWRRYVELGFVSFGKRQGDVLVYTARFDRSQASNACANPVSMTIGANQIRNGDVNGLRAIILHELCHACQLSSASGSGTSPAFTEGTANVARYLMEPDSRVSIGVPSLSNYLDHPGEPMWDRPSPGRDHNSRSSTTLFWLYFFTQLGTRTNDPGLYTDALRDFVNGVNTPDAMASGAPLAPLAVARFLDNDDEQLLVGSEDQRSIHLVSANRAYGIHGSTHWRLCMDQRWGSSGWRFHDGDKVRGTGDFIGDGRHQIVLQNTDPMRIGIVGFTHSDGSPDLPPLAQTHVVVGEDDRWGSGWRVQADDRVQAVGRFLDAERSCLIVSSRCPGYLGVLYVDDSGFAQTGAVVRAGQSLGVGGWVFDVDDEIVASGDFRAAGREQFVIRSRSPVRMGFIGFDAEGRFITHSVVATDANDRFGTGWRLRDGDQLLGTGRLTGCVGVDLVIRSGVSAHLGVVGLDNAGNTRTRLVIRAGGAPGGDWQWQPQDQLIGIGRLVDGDREQMVWLAADRRRLAIVGVGAAGELVIHEYLDATHGKGLQGSDIVPLAIGNLAGLATDQLLASTNTTVQLLSLEQPYLNDPTPGRSDPGLWRTRWYASRNIRMQSTHRYLDDFVQLRSGGQRTFESLWWDFAIANVTRDMPGTPSILRYPVAVDSHPVATESIGFNADMPMMVINRWSSRYFRLPTVSEAGYLQVTVSPVHFHRRLRYAAVVADRGGELKKVHRHTGVAWRQRLDLAAGNRVTLVVTATYAPGAFEASMAFSPVAVEAT